MFERGEEMWAYNMLTDEELKRSLPLVGLWPISVFQPFYALDLGRLITRDEVLQIMRYWNGPPTGPTYGELG